jgi:hypothetical protein
MSWQHTIDLLTVLDRARAAIGLDYDQLLAAHATR